MIVCANDVVAYGALNAARELGRSVPGDVSVTGFDDLPEARWPLLQLTTVAFDLDGHGPPRRRASSSTGSRTAPSSPTATSGSPATSSNAAPSARPRD